MTKRTNRKLCNYTGGSPARYLFGLDHPGDLDLGPGLDALAVDADELVARRQRAVLARRRVDEDLHDVDARAVRRAAADADADQVLTVLLQRHRA